MFGLREEIRTLNASTLEAKQEVAQAHEATSLAEEHASECDREAIAADGKVHELEAQLALLNEQLERETRYCIVKGKSQNGTNVGKYYEK